MIQLFNSKIFSGDDALKMLNAELELHFKDYLKIIITDSNTKKHCLKIVKKQCSQLLVATLINLKPGEQNKNLKSLAGIWKKMNTAGAGRKSVVINIGGGVVCDIGAFAAATYMRGVPYFNVSTTLLAMVDAAIGGKTGIDFNGLKNNIGVIALPVATLVYKPFLKTLPAFEIKNGFAEIIKSALIDDHSLFEKLFNQNDIFGAFEYEDLKRVIAIKCKMVESDLQDNGIRRKLNFGHTIGHSIESLYLAKDETLSHGHAVAIGMVIESILSQQRKMLSNENCNRISQFIFRYYEKLNFHSADLIGLLSYMKHDKKNLSQQINFTLLSGIGSSTINNECSLDEIADAFKIYDSLEIIR